MNNILKISPIIIIIIGSSICMTTCKKKTDPPSVTTTSVAAITQTTASAGGNVSSDGGAAVTAKGICWSTNSNPTTSGSKTSDGVGTGIFTSNLTALTPNTKYYIKAYATNSEGTSYGNEVSFTTSPIVLATLTTVAINSISPSSAESGGNIIETGGGSITARGVCWNTSSNPTTANNKTTDGSGSGSFTSNITGLQPGTTYHIRAYATNNAGTAYGNDLTFATMNANLPKDGFYSGTTNQPGSLSYIVAGRTISSFRRSYTDGGYLRTESIPDFGTMIPTIEGFRVERSGMVLTGIYDGTHIINGTIIIGNKSITYGISDILPPDASFTIDPSDGNFLNTFKFDASGSTDLDDELNELQVRWDFNGDSEWDTDWMNSKQIEHKYENSGVYEVFLEVVDTDGLISKFTKELQVHRFKNEIIALDNRTTEIYEIPGKGFIAIENAGNYDKVVVKYNSSWDILWEKTISGDKSYSVTYIYDIIGTTDNGIILCGYQTEGNSANDTKHILCFKLDDNGNQIWKSLYGNDIYGSEIVETTDNGCLLFGKGQTNEIILLKLNQDGAIEWNKSLIKDNNVSINFGIDEAFKSSDNQYLIFGYKSVNRSVEEYWIKKLDINGNVLSENILFDDINTSVLLWEIKRSNDNEFLICGRISNDDGLICKVNNSGSLIWYKIIPSFGLVYDFFQLPDDNIICLNRNNSTSIVDSKSKIFKINQNGEILNSFTYTGLWIGNIFNSNDNDEYYIFCEDKDLSQGKQIKYFIPF
jgi:hypothetical protein